MTVGAPSVAVCPSSFVEADATDLRPGDEFAAQTPPTDEGRGGGVGDRGDLPMTMAAGAACVIRYTADAGGAERRRRSILANGTARAVADHDLAFRDPGDLFSAARIDTDIAWADQPAATRALQFAFLIEHAVCSY